MTPESELALLLAPTGGGIHTVSSGKAAQLRLQEKLYGVSGEASVRQAFEARLSAIAQTKVVLLGVPSDVGAGFDRGANKGPERIREAMLAQLNPALRNAALDIGDVRVVPQLLDDEMLSSPQLARSQAALFPSLDGRARSTMPVSPLSIASRVLRLVKQINPAAKFLILGGDHSVAWPLSEMFCKPDRAILHFDAHTDLLPERLGVPYCFATWAYHANELLGRGGRLVQVGIRTSGKDQTHWESTLGVRQFWAAECLANPAKAKQQILNHLRALSPAGIYISNDIDGTDSAFAPSTGTPEPNGLTPEFVLELIEGAAQIAPIEAADLVEVAPTIGSPADAQKTLTVAARYLERTLQVLVGT